jgi:putative FmdB family regulatory protein
MPLYEYECTRCGHRFERIQRFSDQPVKKCPECGGKVEQVLSAPAVQFKGSGWYVTDYRKKPAAAGSSSESSPPSESATESKESKDQKPKTEASGKKSEKK